MTLFSEVYYSQGKDNIRIRQYIYETTAFYKYLEK